MLLATSREQTGVFNIYARQLRTTASTHHTFIASLTAGQRQCDAPVDAALICAEVFVSERNEDDGDEREGEDEARGYVPLPKDDTSIFDLRVPPVCANNGIGVGMDMAQYGNDGEEGDVCVEAY